MQRLPFSICYIYFILNAAAGVSAFGTGIVGSEPLLESRPLEDMSAVGYSGGVGMDRFHGYRTDCVGGHGVADDQRGNMRRKRLLLWLLLLL